MCVLSLASRHITEDLSRDLPLTRLTKVQARFIWTDEAQVAFDKLKQALIDACSLAFPYPELPIILDTVVSGVAIGAVVS